MQKQELRAWLARRLKRDEVPEGVWTNEDVEECVGMYLDNRGGLTDIYTAARRVLRNAREVARQDRAAGARRVRPPKPPSRQREDAQHELRQAREEALVAHQAAEARRRPDLRDFQRDVLHGRLLSPREANAFVTSPALRLLTVEQCRDRGVPLVGHTAVVTAGPRGYISGPVTVTVQPPGVSFSVERALDAGVPERLYYPGAAREQVWAVWPGSVVDQAWQLARTLVRTYGWAEVWALRFVLTGRTPPPVNHIEEWVSLPDDFRGRREFNPRLAAWRFDDADIVIAHSAGMHNFADPNPGMVRKYRVLKFVEDRTDADGRPV